MKRQDEVQLVVETWLPYRQFGKFSQLFLKLQHSQKSRGHYKMCMSPLSPINTKRVTLEMSAQKHVDPRVKCSINYPI